MELYTAIDENGLKIDVLELNPWWEGEAFCPECGEPVIAKRGPIVQDHFAHESGKDCDTWYEPVSPWHLRWQSAVPLERREVPMGRHRADAVTPRGVTVEMQHSSIGWEDIAKREAFYPSMVWLFDVREPHDNDRLLLRKTYPPRRWRPGVICGRSFRWKHARKSIATCTQPRLMDLGGGKVLFVEEFELGGGPPYGGWGWLYREDYVRAWMAGSV